MTPRCAAKTVTRYRWSEDASIPGSGHFAASGCPARMGPASRIRMTTLVAVTEIQARTPPRPTLPRGEVRIGAMNKKRSIEGRKRQDRGRSRTGLGRGHGSVPLYKRSVSHFKPQERERGAECFRAGRVDVEIDRSPRAGDRRGSQGRGAGGLPGRYRLVPGREATGAYFLRVPAIRPVDSSVAISGLFSWRLPRPARSINQLGKDRLGLRRDRAASWEDLARLAGGSLVDSPPIAVSSSGPARTKKTAHVAQEPLASGRRRQPAGAGVRSPPPGGRISPL